MTHVIDFSNKGAIEYNSSVNEQFSLLSESILNLFDLTHFIYIKLLDNNKRLYLSNDKNWVEFHIQHELYKDEKHENEVINFNHDLMKKCAIWNEFEKDKVIDAIGYHGVKNGFMIYDKNEIFSFGTKKENTSIAKTYISNFVYFDRFITYFKNAAFNTINNYTPDALIHTQRFSNEQNKIKINAESFINATKINRFYINNSHNQYLTEKEAECLFLLACGLSAKEIARKIDNISHRTIEKKLEIIKNRLKIFSKKSLIDIAEQLHLESYFKVENGSL
jgi:DNA-binding CsgD family transcriptional regulator